MLETDKRTRWRFRFGLRTLLCIPVIFAFGYWWTIWPDRTATRFVNYLNDGNIDAARALMVSEPVGTKPGKRFDIRDYSILDSAKFSDNKFERSKIRDRPVWEWVFGSGEFAVQLNNPNFSKFLHFGSFSAVRGRIFPLSNGNSKAMVVAYTLQSNAESILDRLRTNCPTDDAMSFTVDNGRRLIVVTTREGHEILQNLIREPNSTIE